MTADGVITKFSPYFINTENKDMTRMCLRVQQSNPKSNVQVVCFDLNATAHLTDLYPSFIPEQSILNLTK